VIDNAVTTQVSLTHPASRTDPTLATLWVKGDSLVTTDTRGRDLREIDLVRNYLFAGFPPQAATGNGICQQPRNPLGGGLGLRALLVALDAWVTDGTEPPPSRVPLRRDATLVPSLPQRAQGFPVIPGVTYNGLNTTGDLLLFGSWLDPGILRVLPPIRAARVSGLHPGGGCGRQRARRLCFPDIEVSLATFAGWALRAPEFGRTICATSSASACPSRARSRSA
jgi:hypothetical protein